MLITYWINYNIIGQKSGNFGIILNEFLCNKYTFRRGFMNYIELFKKSVKKNANKVALVDYEGARRTTYAELDLLSDKVAGKLHKMKAKAGDFVMINMSRRMEYWAAYIGIMKAGCAVVPVIPDYPQERIDYIRKNCDVKITVDEDFFKDIDKYSAYLNLQEDTAPALLIYTSGSTGTPKGILHSVADYCRAARRHDRLMEDIKPLVYGAACPLSFMAHMFEYPVVFLMGGTTHMLSERIRKSATEIANYYAKHGITIGTILPQLLRIYKNKDKDLKRVITGSERVSNIYYSDFEIVNMYGMSETTGLTSIFTIDKLYENTPVGTPLHESVQLIVCDENGKELPAETEGEICFKGPFDVIYYKDPEKTAATMVKADDGETIIHSGDIGYKRKDGVFVYVNRKDWMVKVNGQRVDTLEIETILKAMDELKDAAVKAFVDSDGQTYLVAYYVEGAVISQDVIRERLEAKLPYYMIPRYMVTMDALPTNLNGKLDRKSLEPPTAGEFKAEYVAPTNDIEKIICEGFEQILHCGKCGINDDFFALGGDSIKVLKLLEAVNIDDLTTNKILTGKTPKEIAKLCSRHGAQYINHSEDIPKSSPLTDSQRGVYLECMDEPESTMYNIPFVCELPKDIDLNKFINAVRTVAGKHQVLNVTIQAPEGVPEMIYHPAEFVISKTKVKDLDQACRDFVKPFDLENGPLYRFEIMQSGDKTAFVFDIHHLVFDGTSSEAFISQIADVYNGKDCPSEKLTMFDVASSEEALKDSPEYHDAQKYFQGKLDGFEFDSKLVPDQVIDKEFIGSGTINISSADKFDFAAVSDFVKKNKITENTLFLGAFAYALAKFNGTDNSSFCTVNNGRHDPRLDTSVGMFVRTMPLYYEIDEKTSVSKFLPFVQEDFYETMNNDCISFGELASEYGVNTDVMFIYQAELFNGAKFGKTSVDMVPIENRYSQTDLDVMLIKKAGEYELIAHYRKANYTEDLIKTFANLFLNVISEMLVRSTLGDIKLLDADNLALLDSFNDTDSEYDTSKTLVDLFCEQAQKTPDNTCLVFEDKKYTYKEVDELSDNLALHLVEKGVGREKVVGILIPRSEYMLLCSLGVLKAGGAYMPLDPSYPPERLNMMMKDSAAMLLIADPELDSIIDSDFTGLRMAPSDIFDLHPAKKTLPSPKPNDLFIMLYTSGSTGTPKGVMFEHANSLCTAVWVKKYYEMDETTRVAAYASYGFDANVFDMYAPIISGGELHIISEDIRLDFKALEKYFNENGITNTVMTTQVGRQFAMSDNLKMLKHISVAGEKLTPPAVPTGFTLYNLYGPTEGSVITSYFAIKEKYSDVPIGRPVDNLKAYIVDKNGKLLPAGSVGELWISGPHVTRGYLNRPEKMAEAYGDNPFSNDPKYSRVYRTGDIVRYMCDGNLQFVGRRDGQVKVRGFRIELTEVEEVIRRFPAVKDATVAAFDEKTGGKYIAAYVVSDEEISVEELSNFIASEKPAYMVPAVIMQIDKIPLNQNQKVNKRALPVPERNVGEIIKPENEVQQKIFDIVAESIGHKDFGITTDIYFAGLTSISAVKLNVELADAFDVPIKIADIKANSTVKKLEAFIGHSAPEKSYDVMADYPITKTQEGIFIETMSSPNTTVYNIPLLVKLGDGVDLDKLAKAITATINAHPYVKTTLFTNDKGDVRAKRNDDAAVTIKVEEHAKLPAYSDIVRPFKLLEEALYRIVIYKTGEGNYLLMDFHHIVCDGTSEGILFSDIDKAYAGGTLTAEKFTGFEAALEEETARAGVAYEKAKEYWKGLLSGCETNSLPKKDSVNTEAGVSTIIANTSNSTSRIKTFCEENNLTLNAYFNSVFAYIVKLFSGQEELSYATIYNGRSDSRFARCVTMSVKTMPVAMTIKDDIEITELIKDIQSQLMDSMSNDLCSFAELANEYGVNSDIIMAYQGSDFNFDSLCGEKFEMMDIKLSAAKAPISLNVYLQGDNFKYVAEYDTSYFSADFIKCLLDSAISAASSFAEVKYLKDVKLISRKAEGIYQELNNSEMVVAPRYFHQFVEKLAAEKPNDTAVITANGSISFGELNSLANIIANKLIAKGVGRDKIVGLILERGIEVQISELAVVKSGGAFLAMLPSYPDDRIDFCLTDSESPLVITSQDIKASKPELFTADKPYEVLTIEELLTGSELSNPNVEITGEQLICCIYTSGSTGKPKGVMIEHHNVQNFIQVHWPILKYYQSDEYDGASLAMASISFDMSIFDIYMPLLFGKAVYMASEDEIHNPLQMKDALLKNKIQNICCTPSFINNLVSMPELTDAIKNLVTIVVGAEAFPASLYKALRDINPNLQIINGYGPTETTVCCSTKELDGSENITIGKPVGNTKLYIMDKFGNILPPYAVGELIIAGEDVSRGYIKLPEKNKASFFTVNGERAYHSGDMARLNANSEIEFYGRIDNQVKLRGFRVELDEIENVMCSFPAVKQSKVIVRNNGAEDFLAGFFTADKEIDLAELTAHLKSQLTYYMVPAALMQLDQMPLTPNGKIDKKKLPEIKKQAKDKSARRAPKKSLEQKLCEIFANVLDVDEVFADDDFFELGGTSLTASKVTMVLMSENIEVEYGDIFSNPTPELLAQFIEGKIGPTVKSTNDEVQATNDEQREALKWNQVKYASEVKREPLGNVLLTGATGFLGIHVLQELLDIEDGHIYCLVRSGNYESPEDRLKMMLFYYFSKDFSEELRSRITLIEADITDKKLGEQLKDIPFDTVINCAACVKHFTNTDILDRINVHGVENLINICSARDARLVQVSTVSVPGLHTDESYEKQVKMHENELFVIDDMGNKYGISKYKAELKILDAIESGKLRAKIVRVGNLMGRHSDGEFQANLETNMFLSGIRGFAVMGKYPISHMTDPMSFSPIDCTARALVLLAGTNDKFTAFNANSRYSFDEMKIIDACNRNGIEIYPEDDAKYYAEFNKKLADDEINSKLTGLAAYDIKDAHAVDCDNLFTTNILYRIGFSWPLVDDAYLDRAINSIMTLDYFNIDDEYNDK